MEFEIINELSDLFIHFAFFHVSEFTEDLKMLHDREFLVEDFVLRTESDVLSDLGHVALDVIPEHERIPISGF